MKLFFFRLFFLILLFFASCKGFNNNIQPIVKFEDKIFSIENVDKFDYYNLEMKFAGKYNLEYNLLPDGSKVNYKYSELSPQANFLELNKNSVVIKYQDSLGNNYEFAKLKTVSKNLAEKEFNYDILEKIFSVEILALITTILSLIFSYVQVKKTIVLQSKERWKERISENVSNFLSEANPLKEKLRIIERMSVSPEKTAAYKEYEVLYTALQKLRIKFLFDLNSRVILERKLINKTKDLEGNLDSFIGDINAIEPLVNEIIELIHELKKT